MDHSLCNPGSVVSPKHDYIMGRRGGRKQRKKHPHEERELGSASAAPPPTAAGAPCVPPPGAAMDQSSPSVADPVRASTQQLSSTAPVPERRDYAVVCEKLREENPEIGLDFYTGDKDASRIFRVPAVAAGQDEPYKRHLSAEFKKRHVSPNGWKDGKQHRWPSELECDFFAYITDDKLPDETTAAAAGVADGSGDADSGNRYDKCLPVRHGIAKRQKREKSPDEDQGKGVALFELTQNESAHWYKLAQLELRLAWCRAYYEDSRVGARDAGADADGDAVDDAKAGSLVVVAGVVVHPDCVADVVASLNMPDTSHIFHNCCELWHKKQFHVLASRAAFVDPPAVAPAAAATAMFYVRLYVAERSGWWGWGTQTVKPLVTTDVAATLRK